MAIFESLNKTTNTAFDKGEELLRNSEKYYSLKLFQLVSSSLTMFMKFIMIGIFSCIGFIFMAIALAMGLGKLLESQLWGYLATGCIFFVLSLIVYALRATIETVVLQKLSKLFFNDEEL